jgi:hypothetical protein
LLGFEKLYDHLYQRFPTSLVLGSKKETGIENLYLNVFATSMDVVEQRVEIEDAAGETPVPSAPSIGARHDMNSVALTSSKSIDNAMYHTALSKYSDDHDMYGHIVNATAAVVKKHLDNLDDPNFIASYKILDKVSGVPKNDMKYLKRMGVDFSEPSSSSSSATKQYKWVKTPHTWSDKYENDENYRKCSNDKYACVNADSEDVSHSLFYANANHHSTTPSSLSSVAADVEEPASVMFSRKKKKADVEHIGATLTPRETSTRYADSNTRERYAYVKKIPNISEQIAGIVFLTTRVTADAFYAMYATDVAIPIDLMLARPFMTFEMYHAILCKSGRETGATFVGHSDFQLGDDVRSKLHYGHYTFMAKSIVSNPKNVTLMKNIFVNDYLGGWNTEFYDWENGQDDKREQIYHQRNRPSIFSMVLPAQTYLRSNPIDLRCDFPFYSNKLSFHTLSEPNYDNEYFVPNEVSGANPILYRGMQHNYDASKGSFSKITIGTGHLGSNVYPGMMSVLHGQMKHMRQIEYVQNF